MAETLKEKTAKGLFWGGLSNGVQQVLNLVFGIFLARLLTQSDYGMVGMLTIFSFIAAALQEGGFVSAINRKNEVTHNDYNAVFWTSTILGLSFYTILFFCAPLIARFYGIPELTALSRFVFLTFLIGSFGVAPSAYLFRNMMVKERAIASISSLFISGVVGVSMAANGFAYWGIATQSIVHLLVITSLCYYFTKWKPSLHVNFSPIREMFGFGSKLIITNIFNIINGNIFSVLLGKMYSAHEVGNFTQANKWNNMGSALISGMIGNIAQPVFVKADDDRERQKRIFRKLLRFTAFVSFPAMFGLALVAKEFIVILLTEKWLESALVMQMLCISGAFAPISALFSNLIITRGHSTTYMWCSIVLCLLQLIAAIVASPYGINRMIQVYVIVNIGWILVWHHYASKEINLKVVEVLKDIAPYLLLSLILVMAASFLTACISNLFISFIAKVLFFSSVYCFILWALHSTIFIETYLFITKKRIQE